MGLLLGHSWWKWAEQPVEMFPGPIKAPSLFPLRFCVSPTHRYRACSLDRMTVSSTSSGMASRPHLGMLFTVPSSSGAHQPFDRPLSRLGHSAELWTQCQSRARPTTASDYAFPSLSGYCCPCPIIPLSTRHYFSLVHCPGMSTLTSVTTHHGRRFPGKVGPRH